jgi:hypothetical protein
MPDIPPDAYDDCFHPPSIPTEVYCLHCQCTYESYLIEWRESVGGDGAMRGFWRCPTPGCGGAGFGFDIHPVDPGYIDPDGRDLGQWCDNECEDDCTGDEETCCCDCCIMGRGEYEDEVDDMYESFAIGCGCDRDCDDEDAAVPLDDLLPVSEDIADFAISYETMMEIEEKLGFRKPRDAPADSRTPPSGPHPPFSDDDIPF